MSGILTPESELPFAAFRFQVDFFSPGGQVAVARGAFSECSGLEASMEPKVINAGGRNYGPAQRVGQVTFATFVLKRGITHNWDLWRWFSRVSQGAYAYRLNAELKILGPGDLEREQPRFVWKLDRCLPIKFKAPELTATSEQISIEELHLAHEGLSLAASGAGGPA